MHVVFSLSSASQWFCGGFWWTPRLSMESLVLLENPALVRSLAEA